MTFLLQKNYKNLFFNDIYNYYSDYNNHNRNIESDTIDGWTVHYKHWFVSGLFENDNKKIIVKDDNKIKFTLTHININIYKLY